MKYQSPIMMNSLTKSVYDKPGFIACDLAKILSTNGTIPLPVVKLRNSYS